MKFNSIDKYFYFLFILIFFQLLVSIVIFGPFGIISYDLKVYKDVMDGPSYLEFPFESLDKILSHHRTFGMPLILKIYRIFDSELLFWPEFNYLLFSISILCLFYSLSIANFDHIFSFIICFSLIISQSLYAYISWWTSIWSISFLLLTISFFFISLNSHKKFLINLIFAFLLFFTYQIRPAFIIFSLFPVIYIIVSNQLLKTNFNYKKILLLCFLPMLIFFFLRLIIVGNFGLVSFNPGPAANALIYLEKTDVSNLKKNNQIFAEEILKKRVKLPFPCNIENESERTKHFLLMHPHMNYKTYGQQTCWNEYLMLSMLHSIEVSKGITPFGKDDPRNIDAWNHMKTLENFMNKTGSNVEPDRILIDFAKDVYLENKLYILSRIIKSPYYLFEQFRDIYRNQFVIFYFIIFTIAIFKKKIISENPNREIFDKEFVIVFTGFVIFMLNQVLLYGHQNGDPRAVQVQNFYVMPFFFAYLTHFLIYKK